MSFKFDLDMVVAATKGELLSRHKEQFVSVGTDTRGDLSDQVFIALKGANYDAHKFLGKAADAGAGVLVGRSPVAGATGRVFAGTRPPAKARRWQPGTLAQPLTRGN